MCSSQLLVGPDSRRNAPQWASFGAATLEQWLAAGDAAVAAATGDGAACSVAPGEVAVRAAAAVRRRCAGVSFLGPNAAPDAPLASRRGFSVDLAGPKVWELLAPAPVLQRTRVSS